MEGFTKLPKMQCFKEGGYVTSKPKSVVEKTTKVAPTGNKKANAKSAAVAPKEKEDKVDITTMKKGGRAKKAAGTVKKFVKANAPSKAAVKAKSGLKQEAKKVSGDKDAIKKVKDTSKKAAAPSKAAVKGKEIKKTLNDLNSKTSADLTLKQTECISLVETITKINEDHLKRRNYFNFFYL